MALLYGRGKSLNNFAPNFAWAIMNLSLDNLRLHFFPAFSFNMKKERNVMIVVVFSNWRNFMGLPCNSLWAIEINYFWTAVFSFQMYFLIWSFVQNNKGSQYSGFGLIKHVYEIAANFSLKTLQLHGNFLLELLKVW